MMTAALEVGTGRGIAWEGRRSREQHRVKGSEAKSGGPGGRFPAEAACRAVGGSCIPRSNGSPRYHGSHHNRSQPVGALVADLDVTVNGQICTAERSFWWGPADWRRQVWEQGGR